MLKALLLFTLVARLPLVAPRKLHGQVTLTAKNSESRVINPGLDKYVKEILEALHVPGLSLAVVNLGPNGSMQIETKGYGYAMLPSVAATADTLYYTGSTTKAFTAAAAGKLVLDPDNPLEWISRINDIIPEDFVLSEKYASSHTTLEDALSHRSGLPRHDLSYGSNTTTKSIVQNMRHLSLTAELRTRWQYCNLMYAVVTDLLEKVTGQKLATLLRETFWQPLGMRSTFFSLDDALNSTASHEDRHLARGYFWADNTSSDTAGSTSNGFYVPEPYIDLAGLSGAGATISSVADYALWVGTLLRTGSVSSTPNETSPVTQELYRELIKPRSFIQIDGLNVSNSVNQLATPPNYALGWVTIAYQGHVLIAHDGGLIGFGTGVWLLPDDGIGIVTMGNTVGTSNLAGSLIAQKILHSQLDLPLAEAESTANWDLTTNPLTGLPIDTFYVGHKHSSSPSSEAQTRQEQSSVTDPAQTPDTNPDEDTSNQPAPSVLTPYTGTYINPAYGTFNVSLSRSISDSTMYLLPKRSQSIPPLHITPSPHIWPFRIRLLPLHTPTLALTPTSHFHSHFFNAELWWPHGPFQADPTTSNAQSIASCNHNSMSLENKQSKLQCRDEVVWERLPGKDSLLAYFEAGPEGRVERLGIEIEPEMVSAIRKEGRDEWWRGMVWFEREEV